MNRKFVRISLGGVRDEAEIRGHRRTYIGAIPGRIVQALKQAGAMNPVFMLDEIDKISAGFQGDPAAALLEVLDPAQNHSFRDHYLEINMDLSRVLFIATSNQLGTIHPALLDRMEIISLAGYTEEEKLHIARRYLVPRQLEEHGLDADQVTFDDAALRRIIAEYTREAGVRSLERQIGAVVRKIAARIAGASAERRSTGQRQRHWTTETIEPSGASRLPRPAALSSTKSRSACRGPGVATGVAWTETGGDVLFVEASLLPNGHHNLILTGQLGNVMQESARAAVSHIRASARELGIDPGFPRHARSARARPGRRDSQGRAVGRRHHGDGDRLGAAQSVGARGRRDDRRDHAERAGAAGGRHPREGAGGAAATASRPSSCRRATRPTSRNCPPEVEDGLRFVPVQTLEEVLRVALPPDEADNHA